MRIYFQHEHLECHVMRYPPKLVDFFFRHPLSPPTLVCRGNLSQSWMSLDCWLVVYLPLWKRWGRQLGWWQANIWKNQIHVPNHRPDWFLGTFTGTPRYLMVNTTVCGVDFSQQNQSNENGFPQNMGLWTARVEITITQCVYKLLTPAHVTFHHYLSEDRCWSCEVMSNIEANWMLWLFFRYWVVAIVLTHNFK